MAADLMRLARVVRDLAERERQRDELRAMAEEIDRSGLYVVAGEFELLRSLDQRLQAARAALDGLAEGSLEASSRPAIVEEMERLLTGPLWRHADGVVEELRAQKAEIDTTAAEIGSWVAPWHARVEDLERRLLQVVSEGASEKALKDERDALSRLRQRLGSVDEALKDGRYAAALAARALLDPPPAPGGPAGGASPQPPQGQVPPVPGEPPFVDLDRLVASLDEKAAAGRTMTQLAEILLLQGPATVRSWEYTFVLRTPSAPGSHGISIHDTFKVKRPDHARAGKGAEVATGAVRNARRARRAATRDFVDDAPEETGPPVNLIEELRSVGDLLYRVFLPGFAQRLLSESTCPVSITTNDVTMPWELLHDGESFVTLSRPLARMPTGHALPRRYRQRITNRRLRFLLTYADPKGDLPHVKGEVEAIEAGLTAAWGERIEVVVERAPTGEYLNDALRRGAFDVIHFAGHADFDDGDEDEAGLLLFGDDENPTENFPASKILRFVEGSPIVFLNACNTGKSADVPAEEVSYAARPAAGLGSAFVYGGALACVGSLWPVYDESAQFFAVEFYNAIVDRDSIGAAMLAARRATHEKFPDDATWASFVLFGNPTFRLDTTVEAAALAARTMLTSA